MPARQRASLLSSARIEGRAVGWTCLLALALSIAAGCQSTVDSLGYNDAGGLSVLHPMKGPGQYPNAFRDVLGKSDTAIQTKIDAAFNQLFHGDKNTQAIYLPATGQPEQAYITDTLHDDVRTEGIGLGMIIALQLGKREELDRLWTYAQAQRKQTDGPQRGYFMSSCATTANMEDRCLDPFGMEYMLMALLLANDYWSAAPGNVDYAAGAKDLLTVMRHKEDENGGVVDGITNLFDPDARLVYDLPVTTSAGKTRPSVVTPAFYDLWAQATGDPFWNEVAAASRRYWQAAAHPTTGLFPLRSHFDGRPDTGGETFVPETYRTFVNIVLDQIWSRTTPDPWDAMEADRVLGFFIGKGMDTYGKSYTLDGTVIDTSHESSLVIVNGITALITTSKLQRSFIQEVWDRDLPIGPGRYFTGILQMMGLLILSGEFRVY